MPPEDNVFPAEEQPLPVAATPTTDSPGYIPEFDTKGDPEEDDEEDLKEDLADYPADSTVVALPAVDHVPSEDVTKPLPRYHLHHYLYHHHHLIALLISRFPRVVYRFERGCVLLLLPLVRRLGRVQQPVLLDVIPGRPMSKELGYGITDTWDELETTIMYGMMGEAQDDRSQLRGRVNLLYRDIHVHCCLAVMIEREARMAREDWGLSMDASDNAHSDFMSLRTTLVAQHALILDLQAADRRRQGVNKELLAADHKRQVQLTKALRLLKGLQNQMIKFQRHHGPAKGPSQPDAQGEAMIDQGITVALAARDANRNGDDSHTSRTEIDKVERYVDGLPDTIHGSVMATKLKTMKDAIEFATELMNKKINTWAERQADNKRKFDDTTQNNHQQPNKRQNTRRAYATGNGDRRAYKGPRPLCTKCNYHHDGPCAPKCHKCNRFGHLSRDCRNPPNVNTGANQRGNDGNAKAQAKVYAVGKAGANPDNNAIMAPELLSLQLH
nr:hypothetical protein [Tanacetum cinerariifolium]